MRKEVTFTLEHVAMHVLEYPTYIYLDSIVVPEEFRNQGYGTKALQEVIGYAEKQQKPLLMWASNELGGDVDRLMKWYKHHGFYKERNKLDIDFNYNLRREPTT